MKKFLLSALVMVLALGLVGAGAFAYLQDTETSSGNSFTAGTLDLGLEGAGSTGGTSATWVSPTNWAPGDTQAGTINVNNEGTIAMDSVTVDFDYVLTDVFTPTSVHPPGSHVLDEHIIATTVTWNGETVTELQGKTLAELQALPPQTLSGLPSQTVYAFYILWTFDSAADNGCQGDSVAVTLTFAGTQS